MSERFIYDVIEYPGMPRTQTHPDHMGAIARLHGIHAASPRACHYLEVGCGDAANLLPLALAYPDSRFVGVDLSERAIAHGQAMKDTLGLDNLHLEVADLTQWTPPQEPFDYICAHGFYSWVPAPVRDALLRLCEAHLAGNGIAYVSYNTLPGGRMRQMLWDMLRAHVAGFDDPETRLKQAYAFLRLLEKGIIGDDPDAVALRHEVDNLIHRKPPAVLFHDDLASINDPVSITEFAAHADRFGMRFVAESDYVEMNEDLAPEPVAKMLKAIPDDEVLKREQYLDFLKLRRFRQTLLCRVSRTPKARADIAAVDQLSMQGRILCDPDPVDFAPGIEARFRNEAGSAFRVNAPVLKAAMVILDEQYPAFVDFDALLQAACARAGVSAGDDDAMLRRTLIAAFQMGVVTVRLDPPQFALLPGERPVVSPLARAQLLAGRSSVTSLRSRVIELEQRVLREMLLLLDGTRNRDALLSALAHAMSASGEPLPDGTAGPDAADWQRLLAGDLDRNLSIAAGMGLLQASPAVPAD